MLNGNIVKGKLLFWNTSVINHNQVENKLNYFGSECFYKHFVTFGK